MQFLYPRQNTSATTQQSRKIGRSSSTWPWEPDEPDRTQLLLGLRTSSSVEYMADHSSTDTEWTLPGPIRCSSAICSWEGLGSTRSHYASRSSEPWTHYPWGISAHWRLVVALFQIVQIPSLQMGSWIQISIWITIKEESRINRMYIFIIAVLELSWLSLHWKSAHAKEGHLDSSYSYSASWVCLSLSFLTRVHVEGLTPMKVTSDPIKWESKDCLSLAIIQNMWWKLNDDDVSGDELKYGKTA